VKEENVEADATTDLKANATVGELWAGLLVGPMAGLIQLQVNYALVLWSCSHRALWPLHLVSVLALLATLVAGLMAYRVWQRVSVKEDGPGPIARSRLMSLVGVLISILMSLVIIAQWLAVFVYDPCQR
jgi:hypothetical protein